MMYKLIEWPKVQSLMDRPGFKKSSCLANDDKFLANHTKNRSSAYFVSEK